MRGKLRNGLTTRRALVLVVAAMLSLAWAMPSVGASAQKIARKALARANQAFHNADLAIDTSGRARTTANNASSTAEAARSTANAAQSTANTANSTANTALSVANGKLARLSNFSSTIDPGSISSGNCTSSSISRLGQASSDEVIVTPPETQPLGIIVQAYTASGEVVLQVCNVSGSPIDPPSGSYEFSTFR